MSRRFTTTAILVRLSVLIPHRSLWTRSGNRKVHAAAANVRRSLGLPATPRAPRRPAVPAPGQSRGHTLRKRHQNQTARDIESRAVDGLVQHRYRRASLKIRFCSVAANSLIQGDGTDILPERNRPSRLYCPIYSLHDRKTRIPPQPPQRHPRNDNAHRPQAHATDVHSTKPKDTCPAVHSKRIQPSHSGKSQKYLEKSR